MAVIVIYSVLSLKIRAGEAVSQGCRRLAAGNILIKFIVSLNTTSDALWLQAAPDPRAGLIQKDVAILYFRSVKKEKNSSTSTVHSAATFHIRTIHS